MLVYGRNVAMELLKNPTKIKKVFLQNGFDDKKIKSLVEKSNLPIVYKDKRDLDRLAESSHQGIMLDIEDYKYYSLNELLVEDDNGVIVLLDHLEDPHNLGAIIRTCEAAGVDGIVLPKDRGVKVTPTVMKTSAGALENMKLCLVTNLVQTIEILKKNGYWVVGTDMVNSQDYRTIDYSGKIVLVIGNEGNGMSRIVKESCDFIASIPMKGKVNSLNASVASGIMIYEVIRNRK